MGQPGTGLVTGFVDHSRDADGRRRARLLDLVPGRTGTIWADRLSARRTAFTAGITTATLDPFRGYADAIGDKLPEATTMLAVPSTQWNSAERSWTRCAAGYSRTRWATAVARAAR